MSLTPETVCSCCPGEKRKHSFSGNKGRRQEFVGEGLEKGKAVIIWWIFENEVKRNMSFQY
jgi:hypothetical protein